MVIRRYVLFTRVSLLLDPEQGAKWQQWHLCGTAAPFSIAFSPITPKRAPVTQQTKLYKAFPILCIKIMAKLCLPGASDTRCSCARECLNLVRSVLFWVPAGYQPLTDIPGQPGLSAVQRHGFYSKFLPSLPRDFVALLRKPFVES